MAEHAAALPAETGAEMDYPEHERTYSGFIALTQLGIVVCINILLDLILFAFGAGRAGFWLGMLILVLLILASAIGLAMKGSWKPSAAVSVLAIIFVILTVG